MSNLERTVFYLNVVVEDATEAVQNKMADKIDKTPMPFGFKEAAKKVGLKAASKMVSPSAVASKMSEKMTKTMPEKMAEQGLTMEVEPAFLEGPYLVLQLQLQKVDTRLMAELKAEKQNLEYNTIALFLISMFTWFLMLLGVDFQKSLEEELLPTFVQRKMQPKLDELLKVRMEVEMKVEAEISVLGEDKQARYFFNQLKQVRAAAKKGT